MNKKLFSLLLLVSILLSANNSISMIRGEVLYTIKNETKNKYFIGHSGKSPLDTPIMPNQIVTVSIPTQGKGADLTIEHLTNEQEEWFVQNLDIRNTFDGEKNKFSVHMKAYKFNPQTHSGFDTIKEWQDNTAVNLKNEFIINIELILKGEDLKDSSIKIAKTATPLKKQSIEATAKLILEKKKTINEVKQAIPKELFAEVINYLKEKNGKELLELLIKDVLR